MSNGVVEELGVYIAVKYNLYSILKINEIAEHYKVPNIIPLDKFHTTLIYSKKATPNVEIKNKVSYIALPDKLDIWESQSGSKSLVLTLKSKHLIDRNKELTDKYNFISDYSKYIPHITISYSIEDWNRIDEMQTYLTNNKIYNIMSITSEYKDEIQADWSDSL